MFFNNGPERRKNPSNPMVRDWRRALPNEWEADKLRRQKHQEEPRRERPANQERIGGSDGGDGVLPDR